MVSQQLIAWQKRDETEMLYLNDCFEGNSSQWFHWLVSYESNEVFLILAINGNKRRNLMRYIQ